MRYLITQQLTAWDQALTLKCNRLSHRRTLRWVFTAISWLGDGKFWYGLMALLLLGHGRIALLPVLHMLGVGALGLALYKWLKATTSRPRPFMHQAGIVQACRALDQYSFPSGHTLHAVAFSTVALAYFPELAPLLIPFSCLVAWSRPVLGLHYPSDVFAGALLGFGLARFSFLLA